MFRAFLGYTREDIDGREEEKVTGREYLVKTIAPAFATAILNDLRNQGWNVASMSNNVYLLERVTITRQTVGGMSLREFIDTSILFDSVLKIWHAPYIDKK